MFVQYFLAQGFVNILLLHIGEYCRKGVAVGLVRRVKGLYGVLAALRLVLYFAVLILAEIPVGGCKGVLLGLVHLFLGELHAQLMRLRHGYYGIHQHIHYHLAAVLCGLGVAGIYDAILCIGAECIVKCGIQYLNVAYLCNYGILHNCAAACKGTGNHYNGHHRRKHSEDTVVLKH